MTPVVQLLPKFLSLLTCYCTLTHYNIPINHFQDISMDSQTTDITHFAVVFHYEVSIKTLETLRSTANYL